MHTRTAARPALEVKIPAPNSAPAARPQAEREPDGGLVSVVIPALNEEGNIPVLHEKLVALMGGLGVGHWEMVVVDDGSTDGTLGVLRSLAERDQRVRYLSFSRNFGHQQALRAGLEHSRGGCVVAMDADLQHPPALLAEMLRRWEGGAEVVLTLREDAKEAGAFKRATSGGFYRVVNLLGDVRIEPGSADFFLLDRAVVEAIRRLPETELFFRGLLPWLGFRCERVRYRPDERLHGVSKYRVRKMLSLALSGIVATSTRPLRLAGYMAGLVAGLTMLYACWVLLAYAGVVGSQPLEPGWTSLILVVAGLGAMQLLVLGIIGEYLGRVLRETRRRPPYVVRATNCDRGERGA